MYIEGYLFYVSLIGIVILLSYKARVIRAYDRVNKNHILFDPFPKTRLRVLENVQTFAIFVDVHVLRHLRRRIIKITLHICRGAFCVIDDVHRGRKKLGKMIEKNRVASRYIQKIAEQKKDIQKEKEIDL